MEKNVNVLPNGLAGQAPKGRRISKRAVLLYFGVIAIVLLYMGYTATRLGVSPNVQCGAYNVSQVAHAEVTYAWAFVHPEANVSAYVSQVCTELQQSYKLPLPG